MKMGAQSMSLLAWVTITPFFISLGGASTTPALISAPSKFPKDGPLNPAILARWEIEYTAKDYLPVCGSSSETEGTIYWSNTMECDPAMAAFNATSNHAQVAMYDFKGIETTKAVGEGESLCMCFGLTHTRRGTPLDLCVMIGEEGEVMERIGPSGEPCAVGLQGPEGDKLKMLPSCEQYAASSSAAAAAASATSVISSSSATPSPSSDDKEKGGITTEVIVGIAVGLPGALVAIVTMIIYIRKQQVKRARRYNDMAGVEKQRWWKRTKIVPTTT